MHKTIQVDLQNNIPSDDLIYWNDEWNKKHRRRYSNQYMPR